MDEEEQQIRTGSLGFPTFVPQIQQSSQSIADLETKLQDSTDASFTRPNVDWKRAAIDGVMALLPTLAARAYMGGGYDAAIAKGSIDGGGAEDIFKRQTEDTLLPMQKAQQDAKIAGALLQDERNNNQALQAYENQVRTAEANTTANQSFQTRQTEDQQAFQQQMQQASFGQQVALEDRRTANNLRQLTAQNQMEIDALAERQKLGIANPNMPKELQLIQAGLQARQVLEDPNATPQQKANATYTTQMLEAEQTRGQLYANVAQDRQTDSTFGHGYVDAKTGQAIRASPFVTKELAADKAQIAELESSIGENLELLTNRDVTGPKADLRNRYIANITNSFVRKLQASGANLSKTELPGIGAFTPSILQRDPVGWLTERINGVSSPEQMRQVLQGMIDITVKENTSKAEKLLGAAPGGIAYNPSTAFNTGTTQFRNRAIPSALQDPSQQAPSAVQGINDPASTGVQQQPPSGEQQNRARAKRMAQMKFPDDEQAARQYYRELIGFK
jgi:hypothetical protein